MRGKHVLLITGGYYPAPGGAANYSHTLAHLLTKFGGVETVEVFTERYPGVPDSEGETTSGVVVHRVMPWRATRDTRSVWSLFLYIFQILQIAVLFLKDSRRFDAVLLHGSLVYRTAFLARVVGLAKWLDKHNRTHYFLDVRDPLMPPRRASLTSSFDGVVACARNVVRDLVDKGVSKDKIREIPIPLAPNPSRSVQGLPACSSFGLKEQGFALVAHGFTPGKRTEEVIDAIKTLRGQGIALSLAVAGRARYWPANAVKARDEGWLYFLGPLPNDQIRALMAECRIHVNVCTEEGLPRGSLEAIAAGALTVLPPGVPEFEECCPEWIGTAGDPRRLAGKIKDILERGMAAPYPLERHHPMVIGRKYREMLSE